MQLFTGQRNGLGSRLAHFLFFLAVALACFPAHAQLLIGRTAGFSGPVAAGVKETADGARLYIDKINSAGGLAGQRIELVALDDKFDPKLAGENARVLVEEKNMLALFLTRGTPHSEAIIPVLNKHSVPLIGPSTGAMVLHTPLQKHVFNVRSTYQREAEKAILHLSTIGMQRIAVVHADDSFGADGLEGANKGFALAELVPVAVIKADRSKPDYGPIVKRIVAAHSRGVIVTQVFPSERSGAIAIVAEAAALTKERDLVLSPAILEGFAAAKVLVEGLRRASPRPTRDRLQAALEGMTHYDLGGLEPGFSRTSHTGLNFCGPVDHWR